MQLQNDCIFEWFKLKMLLIKIVVLMVKNQTTLSSFQNYFFEMNNEKRGSFPLQFPTFNFPPPPWFEPPSSCSLSLSLRRASVHCSIKISYEKEQNLIIETTFTYVFLHIFAKELQLKIYFCIQLQNNCVLTKILHKIFKMFVILYN